MIGNISRYQRKVAVVLLWIFLVNIGITNVTYALTSGPTQPEVQGFTPYSANDMVDLFSGNFSYNIPLLEIPGPNGGYPVNLSYSSGIAGDDEASWVGLGWNLSVGQINRSMRGLPDEFNGDIVQVKKDAKPNVTVGVGAKFSPGGKAFGLDPQDIIQLSAGVKLYSNSYKGYGYSSDFGIGISLGLGDNMSANMGLDFSNDRFEGASVSPSIGLGIGQSKNEGDVSGSLNLGMNYNSNRGISDISLSAGVSQKGKVETVKWKGKDVKKETGAGSVGASATLAFASGGLSPTLQDRTVTNGINLSFKPGFGWFGVFGYPLDCQGFYNIELLKNRGAVQQIQSFGFQHYDNAYAYTEGEEGNDVPFLSDHHYEKETSIHKSLEHLPIPIGTYDIYSVTGQGIGAQIKPYHSNVGVLPEPHRFSRGGSGSFGLEGLGHFGFSAYASFNKDQSGLWRNAGSSIHDKYTYQTEGISDVYFEPTFFQSYGQSKVYTPEQIRDILVGFEPTRVAFAWRTGLTFDTENKLYKDNGAAVTDFENNLAGRTPRNTVVQAFTMEQLKNEGVFPHFRQRYSKDPANAYDLTEQTEVLSRLNRPAHHYGGFEGISPEGTRYIYGLPAYNEKTVETSYSVAVNNSGNPYPGSVVNATRNGKGGINYDIYEKHLDRKETPPYAHAYLLTSVLGADYVDVTNDGVSDDDLGYWVRIGYVNTHDKTQPYKWRAPFRGGNFVEGLLSYNQDDKGAYNYGERENWYVSTIETKSHVAEFYISPRADALGALEEVVSLSESISPEVLAKSYKLDSIKLYTKQERYVSGSLNAAAIPIKSVYFQYAGYAGPYENTPELCRMPSGLFNAPSGRGKLTLMSVWFKNKDNTRGQEYPYVFNYHTEDAEQNPYYHPFANDRWGYYQPETGANVNKYYPYVRQTDGKDTLDKRSAVWNLKEITLPGGAKIQVDYEADDYAYIQHKKAMQMYTLEGEYNKILPMNGGRVYFKLAEPIAGELSAPEKKKRVGEYLDNTGQVYFKVLIDMINKQNHYEYISGYAEIEDYGWQNSTTGYIDLKMVSTNKAGAVHPFSIAAWNYLQMSRPELMTGNEPLKIGDPEQTSARSKVKEIFGVITGFVTIFSELRNFYSRAKEAGFGSNIIWDKSYIRLNNVTGFKYGGGNRVKQVRLISHYEEVADTSGVVYDYSTIENGRRISSGVASYEPMIGGDETALRYASFYDKAIALNSYVKSYTELPVQESYYPAASVGYSRVEIKSINTDKVIRQELPVYIPTTGVAVKEFYTYKDYPVFTSATRIDDRSRIPIKSTPPITVPFLGSMSWEKIAASQGYYVELNDMSGKEKASYNYRTNDEGQVDYASPVSYVKQMYHSKDTIIRGIQVRKLDNYIPVTDGFLKGSTNKYLGIDYEIYNSTRHTKSFSMSTGMRLNLEPAVFFAVLAAIPSVQDNVRETFLAVNNKIVHRFGIPYATEEYSEGSYKVVRNEVFDELTAQPVLTSFTDEYQDTVFQYTIPAHWVYEGMGAAYQNIGARFTGDNQGLTADGNYYVISLDHDNGVDHLISGDELQVGESKVYVAKVNKADKKIWIQAASGQSVPSGNGLEFSVVRSGYRNLLNSPGGSILSKENPIKNVEHEACN